MDTKSSSANSSDANDRNDGATSDRCRQLRLIGISTSILILWNGVCDLIYAYSPDLSGLEYFSPAVWDTIRTAGHRPHWMIMVAQTAGWFYPLYALTYYQWWVGMRSAGFWLAHVPCALLAYAVLMIGGIQHAGWAFLTVLAQARSAVGCSDEEFYSLANRFQLEHFLVGDLTAVLALSAGTVWHAVGILSGRTAFPRWFVVLSPLSVLAATLCVGICLPAPLAGLVIAPFGTWFVLVPSLACTAWLWHRVTE